MLAVELWGPLLAGDSLDHDLKTQHVEIERFHILLCELRIYTDENRTDESNMENLCEFILFRSS